MRRLARVSYTMSAAVIAGAMIIGAPAAGAADLPSPNVPLTVEVSSADVVEKVRTNLDNLGLATRAVDPALTDSLDRAIVDAIPGTILRQQQTEEEPDSGVAVENPVETVTKTPYDQQDHFTEGIQERFVEEEAVPLDPNYRWQMDPVSKGMAGKPTSDFILHRVPGSWFDAPRIPEESMVVQNQDKSLYGPSTPVYVGDSMMCTLGVAGTDAQGHKVGLTAGHCGKPGDTVYSADSWQVGPSGTVVATNELYDYSVIELGSNAEVSRSYNGVTVNHIGGTVQPGDVLCKQGVATGNTCGPTLMADKNLQISQVCAMVGDSGAPVMRGDRMVGMVSGGTLPNQNLSCRTPLQGFLFMPTASTSMDAVVFDLESRGGVGTGFILAD